MFLENVIKCDLSLTFPAMTHMLMYTRLVPGPNLGPAATSRDLRLYPEVCFFLYCDKFASFSHLKSRLLTTDH